MSDTSENNNQDTNIDNNVDNNVDHDTTNSKVNETMICQEVFNPKTEKGKFKVDCWNVKKNGDITPRDVNKKVVARVGLLVMYVIMIFKEL